MTELLPVDLSDDGLIIYCSSCPATLAAVEPGWLEHHADGSHTRHYDTNQPTGSES